MIANYVIGGGVINHVNIQMKTVILSWLQNGGSREFSVDKLKGNNFPKSCLKLKLFKAGIQRTPYIHYVYIIPCELRRSVCCSIGFGTR